MNENMIFNLGSSGGGTSLNFKVVGNPQPENPKENTIWIDTDTPIDGWVFSAAQPEAAQEGMVWFCTGTSSTAAFNALKKNGITVYPLSAKQYVGGAWVNKTAKTYLNGEWVEWIVWIVPNDSFTWSISSGGNVIRNADDSITVQGTSSTIHGLAFTDQAFDLTGFNLMTVVYTATRGYAMSKIGVSTTKKDDTYSAWIASIDVKQNSNKTTATLDISGINEPVYFGASEFSGTVTVYEIKLEV